jgi:hypothetical protein
MAALVGIQIAAPGAGLRSGSLVVRREGKKIATGAVSNSSLC